MCDLITFVMVDEVKRIKAEIGSKKLSIIFDGTTRLGEALPLLFVTCKGGQYNNALFAFSYWSKARLVKR